MIHVAAARVIPLCQPESLSLREWALFYAGLGLRVLPVHVVRDGRCSCGRSAEPTPPGHGSPGKHPWTPNGRNDATADLDRVRAWWKRSPQANIGIACGSELVVFDVDDRSGGAESWRRVVKDHNPPAAPIVKTGSGLHVYMRDPTGRVNASKNRLGPGVDIQGGGNAYVIAPPSLHPSGRRYKWLKGSGPVETRGLPEIPRSILDILDPPKSPRKPLRSVPRASGALPTPYGRKALDGLLDDIARAAPGDRHNAVYRAAARAGELIRAGHLDGGTTFDALVDAGLAVGGDKYSREQVERTVRDAIIHPSGSSGAA